MLSCQARQKLECELYKLQERRTKLFTNTILSSNVYFKIQNRDKSLGEKERNLINLVQEFDKYCNETKLSRYDHEDHSMDERLQTLESLLQQIEMQISQIEWE